MFMACDVKNPTQPSTPATKKVWLVELLQEIQRLRTDFNRQDSSIREIRSISLENQHILRTRLEATLAAINNAPNNRIPRANTTPPAGINTNRSLRSAQHAPATCNHSANRTTARSIITARSLAILNATTPVPRPTPASANRYCWYHRQFGATSAKCIEPCSFIAPSVPHANISVPTPVIRSVVSARTSTATSNELPSTSSSSTQGQSSSNNATFNQAHLRTNQHKLMIGTPQST